MFIEPTITWVPPGFSGYIWLDSKIVLNKIGSFTSGHCLQLQDHHPAAWYLPRPICGFVNCRVISVRQGAPFAFVEFRCPTPVQPPSTVAIRGTTPGGIVHIKGAEPVSVCYPIRIDVIAKGVSRRAAAPWHLDAVEIQFTVQDEGRVFGEVPDLGVGRLQFNSQLPLRGGCQLEKLFISKPEVTMVVVETIPEISPASLEVLTSVAQVLLHQNPTWHRHRLHDVGRSVGDGEWLTGVVSSDEACWRIKSSMMMISLVLTTTAHVI